MLAEKLANDIANATLRKLQHTKTASKWTDGARRAALGLAGLTGLSGLGLAAGVASKTGRGVGRALPPTFSSPDSYTPEGPAIEYTDEDWAQYGIHGVEAEQARARQQQAANIMAELEAMQQLSR